jgi:murein DD-endopeptidase MepM/ murein hydrolase activator NlpD
LSENPKEAGGSVSQPKQTLPEQDQQVSEPPRKLEHLEQLNTSSNRTAERLITIGAWLLALSFVFLAVDLAWGALNGDSGSLTSSIWHPVSSAAGQEPVLGVPTLAPQSDQADVDLPPFQENLAFQSISRRTIFHTVIPTRPREDITYYTVGSGDSVFAIAKMFNIKPETVLWANYDQLKDSPDMLSPGMKLRIPPVDGVYYEWKEGDTFESVASEFKTDADNILDWSGNHIDLIHPEVAPGQMVMVPGGEREFVQWVIPTIPRGKAGVSKSVYGPGACEGAYEGAYGSGTFIWPSGNHTLSGNDYWSGHLGIDIAAQAGDGMFASDSGVVVFAGWSTVGYGNMVMIDHGNGYQTLYGHMSAVSVHCGQSVYQGSYIGAAGSTGNSTGPHIHFEIRYMGGFINPWSMLP